MTPSIVRTQFRLAAGRGRAGLRCERGSSSVEFALSASLLFMSVVGIIYMTWALYSYNVVSEAAREGARFAIVRGSACTTFATACPASSGDIQTHVRNLGFPGINNSKLTASTAWAAYPSGTCTPSASCNNPGNQVTVTVSYSFPVAIPFVPNRTLSMSNTAAMVISQ